MAAKCRLKKKRKKKKKKKKTTTIYFASKRNPTVLELNNGNKSFELVGAISIKTKHCNSFAQLPE